MKWKQISNELYEGFSDYISASIFLKNNLWNIEIMVDGELHKFNAKFGDLNKAKWLIEALYELEYL